MARGSGALVGCVCSDEAVPEAISWRTQRLRLLSLGPRWPAARFTQDCLRRETFAKVYGCPAQVRCGQRARPVGFAARRSCLSGLGASGWRAWAVANRGWNVPVRAPQRTGVCGMRARRGSSQTLRRRRSHERCKRRGGPAAALGRWEDPRAARSAKSTPARGGLTLSRAAKGGTRCFMLCHSGAGYCRRLGAWPCGSASGHFFCCSFWALTGVLREVLSKGRWAGRSAHTHRDDTGGHKSTAKELGLIWGWNAREPGAENKNAGRG